MSVQSLFAVCADLAAVATLPGNAELALLTAGSLLRRNRPQNADAPNAPRLAVVVPAHNEEASIGGCLGDIHVCRRRREAEVFVIADNCTDRTAGIARAGGATVLERHDAVRRGKGHALEFAFQRLLPMGFDAFVVIDADSRVEPNLLEECALAFGRGALAVQAPYLASNPAASASTELLGLALRAFNLVRPRGRSRLGLSSGVLGNGFGLRRETLEAVPYTSHSVVEDLEYHLELLRAGVRVELLESTCVYGAMPEAGKGRATQRARWEGGRLRILRERGLWLAGRILRGQLRFAEALLDLTLPPLAFHALLLLLAVAGSGWSRVAGVAGLSVLAAHLAVTLALGPSLRADLRALARVPGYVFWKLLQLPRIVGMSRRDAAWVRTARAEESL